MSVHEIRRGLSAVPDTLTSMRFTRILFLLGLFLTANGCHSAYVEATVSNRTASPVSLIEVAYPSASFGTQSLAPGADFHYRFKVLGSGPMKLTYTDSAHKEKTSAGPSLGESSEGALTIVIASDGVHWEPAANLKILPKTAP